MKTFLQNTVLVFAGIGIGGLMIIALGDSLKKNDEATCYKLQSQSVEFKDAGFYITKADKSMCDYLNIPVDAPVGGYEENNAEVGE